jgi:hypothetical protein
LSIRAIAMWATLLSFVAARSSLGVVTVNVQFDPGTTNTTTTPITGSSTTGDQMAGMIVAVEFANGTSASAVWAATGPQAGAAVGTGWTLRTVGDTFFSEWTFENNTGLPVRAFRIDAGPGDTLFDTTFGGAFGTPGTARGLTFRVNASPDGLSIVATYRDLVGIQGAEPVGDVFRRLEVAFTNVDGFGTGGDLIFQADTDNIEFGGDIVDTMCVSPWDNGVFDERTAQASEVGVDAAGLPYRRVSADDFWLCEGSIHRIDTIRATLITNALVPKAEVEIYENCDGVPGRLVARATARRPAASLPPTVAVGNIMVSPTTSTYNGYQVVAVTASFPALYLQGGNYFISIWGFSGTSDPIDQFYWGTSGDSQVKGLPGIFFNSGAGSLWTSTDDLGCGCTDFNFQVEGESCKILIDNGNPVSSATLPPGESSVEPASGSSSRTRSADQFVVPPCEPQLVCYLEAYLWTNCPSVGLELYDPACHCPVEGAPAVTLRASSVIALGPTVSGGLGSAPLKLVKAVFTQFPGRGLVLADGRNYWLSAFGIGDASLNARALFAYAERCDRSCPVRFDPLCRASGVTSPLTWTRGSRDHAFLIASADDVSARRTFAPNPVDTRCPADFNRDRVVTVQDVFDFLSVWFGGC